MRGDPGPDPAQDLETAMANLERFTFFFVLEDREPAFALLEGLFAPDPTQAPPRWIDLIRTMNDLAAERAERRAPFVPERLRAPEIYGVSLGVARARPVLASKRS